MLQLSEIFKLLSDETRLRIVILLKEDELCVCELCGILELSQPKVSKHLAKLKDKGLVDSRRDEQYIYYSLNIQNKIINNMVQEIINNKEEFQSLNKDLLRLKNKNLYSGKI